ncbi:MAG: 4-phosphopantetheinyl transferase [Adhaeribacter sp.]|jgi:4'-phosphopantetheinyl transferase|nr:4-phosphopantetheinyl transferase [Adhaeribacter sp.]
MALLEIREINPATYLGFWEITEPQETLQHLLQTAAGNCLTVPAFTSATRQRQWLSSRLLAYTLLQKFTDIPVALQSTSNGKPVFANDAYQVSLTHSRELAGAIISKHHKVGIDIEIISPKVLRVADKFMTPTESADAGGEVEKTLIYWSAKETLYKLYSKRQLTFKEHIQIAPFCQAQPGTLNTCIKTPEFTADYQVYYEKMNDYILTYGLAPATENI